MLVRILHFLLGAALAGGGGYLAWINRASAANIFPPGADGMPWLAIAGILGVAVGTVFLVSAVHPRPNRRARLIAEAEVREAKLGQAETYYSERSRAADRDWRSADIPAPAAQVPAPAPEPVRAAPTPAPAPPPAPVTLAPVTLAPAPQAVALKPVATSAPPLAPAASQTPFPATATLAPIPAASEPPPALVNPPAPVAAVAPAIAPAPAALQGAFSAIRAAIAAGQLDDAEKMLNTEREKAEGAALAELTGLAGDHAAAAGRLSNAKWLWRLAIKRFGELGAMDTPTAKAVAESLRTAG